MRKVFSLALLAGSVAFLVASTRLSAAAGSVPMLVAAAVAVLLGVELWQDRRNVRSPEPEQLQRQRSALAWTAALPIAVSFLGIISGPALYAGIYARWSLRASRWLSVVVAVVVVLLLTALFDRLPMSPAPGLIGNLW